VTGTNQRKVAIIENDDAVRDSFRLLLEVTGYAVETFALAAGFLRSDIRDLACLICDHHLPNMTGLELVERLRSEGIAIPVLLITGEPSPTVTARAAELGIERVLTKPVNGEDVLDFIATKLS